MAPPPRTNSGTNATVISVSHRLVVTINRNVPSSVIVPETSEVRELFSMVSILSMSFVNRDMISPVGLRSKYRTGSVCRCVNRSLRICSTAPCEIFSISSDCT